MITSEFTNIFGDSEVVGKSPDAESDFYHVTDAQRDHHYWQSKLANMLKQTSQDPTKDFFILYGGVISDSGSGQIDISAGCAVGADDDGEARIITIPALTNVALPTGWKDNRQIWVIGKYDYKLGTATRNHYIGTSYHYQLEDTYYGDSNGEVTPSGSDDLFEDSDPGDTVVCWGSFQMTAGDVFTDLSAAERTREWYVEKCSVGSSTALRTPEWTISTAYIVGDIVRRNYSIYVCGTAHTSGSNSVTSFFTNWFTNGYWICLGEEPGSVTMWTNAVAPPGKILCDNKTVGDASSGADYAGNIYYELYNVLNNVFGGTFNWSNHDKINLNDMRGIYPKGAGTTNRTLGKDANGNFYAATLGTYTTDKMQGHRHNRNTLGVIEAPLDVGAGSYDFAAGSYNYAGKTTTGDPVADGTNGTPRTGLTTEPQNLGLTFIIKY